jgi:3-oxoadipate enol-lactonase
MDTPRLDVEIVGKGRDLVLLHSLLSDRSSYEPLAARIGGERRLILVSLPGFGASPRAGPGIGDYAKAVAGLFDDLALPPETDVLGNGLGGFVALALASRHGARFERIVLVGSAIAFPEGGRATFRALAAKVEKDGMGAVADAAMRRMFPEAFIAANPEVVAGRAAVFRRIDPAVFASACRMLAALDLDRELVRIQNPTPPRGRRRGPGDAPGSRARARGPPPERHPDRAARPRPLPAHPGPGRVRRRGLTLPRPAGASQLNATSACGRIPARRDR